MKNKGELFVISGPSGVGKGVICKALLLADDKIRFSVSATTRAPRPGEEHGVSYFFVTREEFEGMIQRNELLEYMDVFGMNYYGTPKAYIEKLTSEGIDVILDIDVNGARNVKKQRPEAVSIFILPPSMQALHSRLVGRGTETPEAVEKPASRILLATSLMIRISSSEKRFPVFNASFSISPCVTQSLLLHC